MTPTTTGTQMGAPAQQTQPGSAPSQPQQQGQQTGQTRQPGTTRYTDWASI